MIVAPPAALRERLLEAVRREPALPRRAALQRSATLLTIGFVISGAIAAFSHRFAGANGGGVSSSQSVRPLWHVVAARGPLLPHRPLGYLLVLELVWLLVVIAATWAGVVRGRSMLGRSARQKLAVAALTPLALIFTWQLIARAMLDVLDDPPDLALQLHCLVTSVACAAGPFLAFLALNRSSDPISPRRTGAAIGAVAGAWGALVYAAFCECTSEAHVALAHVLPVAMFGALGGLVGRRVVGVHGSGAVRAPARQAG